MIGRKISGAGESKTAEAEESEDFWKVTRSERKARRARSCRGYGSNVKVRKPKRPPAGIVPSRTLEPQIVIYPGKEGAEPTTLYFYDSPIPPPPKMSRAVRRCCYPPPDQSPFNFEDYDLNEVVFTVEDVPGAIPVDLYGDLKILPRTGSKVKGRKAKHSPAFTWILSGRTLP